MFGIVQFINGGFTVVGEGDDPNSMEIAFYNHIAAILNDSGAAKGCVKLVDENLDVYDGCIKFIDKPAKA
jgi:hypothetical protein